MRVRTRASHGDIDWPVEDHVGGAYNFLVVALLGGAVWALVVSGAARLGKRAPAKETPLLDRNVSGDVYFRLEVAVALAAFLLCLRQACRSGAPAHLAYPNLHAALRLVHAYAGLPYMWVFGALACTGTGCAQSPRNRIGLRRLVLALWIAWLALYGVLAIGLRGTQYAGFWATDCSGADAADAAGSAAAHAALEHFVAAWDPRSIEAHGAPWLCVAVASKPRAQQYLTTTLGSLLGGLTAEQVAQTRIKIVGSVPLEDYAELHPFLGRSGERLRPLVEFAPRPRDSEEHWVVAENIDYAAALEACGGGDFEHVLAIEDDAAATAGVVDKLAAAIREVDRASAGAGGWKLLKLFVSEYFAGHWTWDLGSLSLLAALPLAVGAVFESLLRCAVGRKHGHDVCTFLVAFAFAASAAAYAVWAVGRANFFPLFPLGVSRYTPSVGACASTVANLYPAGVASDLAQYLRTSCQPTDLAICDFTAGRPSGVDCAGWSQPDDIKQWLYIPSLFQHIGRYSSIGHNEGSCVFTKTARTWRPA